MKVRAGEYSMLSTQFTKQFKTAFWERLSMKERTMKSQEDIEET